jgi:3-demethoxyubiquinol 3-hydroxylase
MKELEKRPSLPGDGNAKTRRRAMIRVNQAGEFGAKQIYAGQLPVLGHTESGEAITHMKDQEQVHLDTFNELMVDEGVRPTILTPIWRVAGFALGAGTALMGKEAAMACTVAVEDVIDAHYRDQSAELSDDEPLKKTVDQFRAEELEHRDIALDAGAKNTPGYRLLTGGIRAATRFAIRLSTKI